MNTKDFFLHLGIIITLYVSVGSLLTLIFQIINIAIPDATQTFYYDPYSGAIRFAIASLIVLFPVFLILSKMSRKNPERLNSGFRRFLIYLTLFIAGGVLLGDLIVIINSFLGGEITLRFILKALSLGVIMALVFGYYKKELKTNERQKGYEIISIVLVLLAIIGGFYHLGSPFTQRDIVLDQQRVSDLQEMQWRIVNYWQSKEMLPESLEALEDSIGGFNVPVDPETEESYVYLVTGDMSFELCATFERESIGVAQQPRIKGFEDNWGHGSGKHCFERDIDPDLYPPFNN